MIDAALARLLLERDREVAGSPRMARRTATSPQRLYVTPKTVEVHLTNAYRKLNIGSRRELSEALTA